MATERKIEEGKDESVALMDLLSLLSQASEHQHARSGGAAAEFPGLDSYAPSYVSSDADSQGVGQWVIGTKSLKR